MKTDEFKYSCRAGLDCPDRDFWKDDSVLQRTPPGKHSLLRNRDCREEWAAVAYLLRVPILLLGVVGALGLLAYSNPRFAQSLSMVYRPEPWLSIVFLSLAGCVTAALTADWIAVHLRKRTRGRPQCQDSPRRWRGC